MNDRKKKANLHSFRRTRSVLKASRKKANLRRFRVMRTRSILRTFREHQKRQPKKEQPNRDALRSPEAYA